MNVTFAPAGALAVRPAMMENLAASGPLFARALALAALILLVRNRHDREQS